MSTSYKIRSFNRDNGSIVVEFMEFPPFNIDLPIKNGRYPEGDALDTYVKGFLPIHTIERKQNISVGIENADVIAAMVEEQPAQQALEATELSAEALANAEMWAAQQFESQVAKVLVKFGVLTEDPTVIPVSVN
jgi:hypothetical protein